MTAVNVVVFGANGVAAGSWAAAAQTPFTADGSIFSLLQSAGAVRNFAASTSVILGAFGALAGYYTIKMALEYFAVHHYTTTIGDSGRSCWNQTRSFFE